MGARLAATLFLAAGLHGCLTYEYEHEFWLRVDGSGTVNVTGRPALFLAFKGLVTPADEAASREAARQLFERAGLRVRRVTLTHREGRAYLFVSADFADINKLTGSPAFPDLRIALSRAGDNLRLDGGWVRPGPPLEVQERDGLMAVRFHLPSKIYEHKSATDGVERGNIVCWRQDVAAALRGERLEFGAVMDSRSILFSTVTLFAGAMALATLILGGGLYLVARHGRKGLASPAGPPAA
ncbi:MAG TPA: hypothetical protein VN375_14290 [Vicinamibacteria bacterium]|nr:hypothetical protein [Vicinamibacteria bacterium]